LFRSDTVSTTLTSAYAVGDATLNVASTAAFNRATGGSYLLKVNSTATSGSGDASYYLTATGSTGTTFTGVSATGQFGTNSKRALSGDTVEEVYYVTGHPVDVLLKVLMSTGTGGNGSYDKLPAQWGFGLPQEWIDIDDAERWRDGVIKVASGTYTWDLFTEEAITDPGGWLAALYAAAGIWLTMRQGRLTVRAAQDPYDDVNAIDSEVTITDDDIVEVREHELYDGNIPIEYTDVYVQTGTGGAYSASTTPDTFPSSVTQTVDLSVTVWSNEGAVRTEVARRLLAWAAFVPERLDLTLRGWELAELCPGDIVHLTTSLASGRGEADGETFADRPALVTEVAPAWGGATTDVSLAIVPSTS